MSPLVYIVMFGWIPAVLYIFGQLPARRALVVSFIAAWLFLPQAAFPLPGLPDYTKMSATCYGVLLATILFDAKRFSSFRPSWLDLPMLVWCLCPFASSISNGLGWYDGVATVLTQTVTWGIPYFLGRVYLNDLDGLRKLAIGIFIGGLIYIPLCLYEIRLSPQLHRIVYGYANQTFDQTMRYGGYRPAVFMEHGLMVGAWMIAATLIGVWLWRAGVIKQLWGIPIKWLVAALLVTTILVKSTGAWFLLALGILVLFIDNKWFRNAVLLFSLVVSIWAYLYLGVTGTYIADQVASSLSRVVPQERVESLEFRFNNEELLSDKARERIIFGWGGYGRNRVYAKDWKGELVDISITDSLWIIAFGINGAVGLISLAASLLLPVIMFLQRYPASLWLNRKVAPAAALVVLLALYMLDCLLNAMINPIYILACGGIAGVALKQTTASMGMGNRPLGIERSSVQQRQHQRNLLAPSKSDGRQS